jgi:hypothetical protein
MVSFTAQQRTILKSLVENKINLQTATNSYAYYYVDIQIHVYILKILDILCFLLLVFFWS